MKKLISYKSAKELDKLSQNEYLIPSLSLMESAAREFYYLIKEDIKKSNSVLFKGIASYLKSANIILLVINHIQDEITINPMQRKKSQLAWLKQGETLPGGKKPIYLSNNIIRLDSDKNNIELVQTEVSGKLDKASIVQELGEAEDKVMSQKAVNDKLKELSAKQEIIYDVSARNGGEVFESLQSLLSSPELNSLIPTSVRCGGMSIRFIQGSAQSSDNKYVQYRLMSDTFSPAISLALNPVSTMME